MRRLDRVLYLIEDGFHVQKRVGLGKLSVFCHADGVSGDNRLQRRAVDAVFCDFLRLALLEGLAEHVVDAQKLALVAEIREKVDFDEDIELAGVDAGIAVKTVQNVDKMIKFPAVRECVEVVRIFTLCS